MLETRPGLTLLIPERATWNETGPLTAIRVACRLRMTGTN